MQNAIAFISEKREFSFLFFRGGLGLHTLTNACHHNNFIHRVESHVKQCFRKIFPFFLYKFFCHASCGLQRNKFECERNGKLHAYSLLAESRVKRRNKKTFSVNFLFVCVHEKKGIIKA